MYSKVLNIVIIGTGGIGIRHIEGLLSIPKNFQLNFFISDLKTSALNFAMELIKKYRKDSEVYPFSELDEIKKNMDLIIIATTSYPRLDILKSILEKKIEGFIILEKLLAPNYKIFNEYLKYNSENQLSSRIYVNQWYHSTSVFNCIYKNSPHPKNIFLKGNGWGMACNSVHYISLFEKLFNTEFKFLDSHLEVLESKRNSYKELIGTIILKSNQDINMTISCNNNNDKNKLRRISIFTDKKKFLYNYDGRILFDKENLTSYNMPYLSSFLKNIYSKNEVLKNLMNNFLPIQDSIRNHKCLFEALKNSSINDSNYFT